MPTIKVRLIASEDDVVDFIARLHGLDTVERIEQVADLMPHMDDEDSSSAGLPDDIGPGLQAVEIGVSDEDAVNGVRRQIALIAEEMAIGVEFVEEF